MASFFEGILEHATECICSDSWTAKDSNQLTIRFGDHINIIERTTNDWWYGECNDKLGYIPTNYIKLRLDHFIDKFNVQTRIAMESNPEEHQNEIEQCTVDYIQRELLCDPEYFEGYNCIKIHHEMLSDVARTKAYQNAAQSLKPYIEGKIVLDVGCGTGILSIFCAKMGAKHVYGVEASPFAFKTRKVVAENGLTGKISILHGKIEDIFLPVESVDVIISEWMGTMLVTESMICSVLFARDKYLKGYIKDTETPIGNAEDSSDGEIIVMDDDNGNDAEEKEVKIEDIKQPPPLPKELMSNVLSNQMNKGLMMPSHCNLYFAPIDLSNHIEEKIDYFDDVYGVNMKCLKEDANELYLAHSTFEIEINEKNLLCDKAQRIKHYDMYNCTEKDDLMTLEVDFSFAMDRDGMFCGFCGWFDVIFNALNETMNKDAVLLDTSPKSKRTHWSQTLFPLSDQVKVKKGDKVTGTLCFFRNNVSIRDYRMFIKCKVKNQTFRKMFFLWD